MTSRGLFLTISGGFLLIAATLCAPTPAEAAVAPVELLDSVTPWNSITEPMPDLRGVPPDAEEYVFEGSPVLRNGRITIAVLNTGIHLFSVAEDGKATLRSRIILLGAGEATAGKLTSVEVSRNEHGELVNRRDRASLTVAFEGPGKPLRARILLTRDSMLCKVSPVANVEFVRIFSNPQYLLMPAFVGDDLLFAAADHRPGRAFLPSENILMELVDNGNAIVQIVWPTGGEQVIEAEVAETAEGRRLEFVQIMLDGQGLYVACWEHGDLWHSELVDGRFKDNEGKSVNVPIEWQTPFAAQWRTVYHGDRSTSWEMRGDKATGMMGPHGSETFYVWPFRLANGKIELHHPPRQIQEGQARTVLLYPLQRTGKTPRRIPTPADVLREALGNGPCEYLLARDQRQRGAPGGPLCVLGARFGILSPSYARNERSSQFMSRLVDWCVGEGVWQFERAQDYLNFAKMVQKKLDTLLKSAPELGDQYESVRAWDDELLQHAARIVDVMPSRKAGWADFVPKSNEAIPAMKELAEHLKTRLRKPRNPETLAEWGDLMGKLHGVAVHPQVMLPRARRLTRMIQNQATHLATLSPQTSQFASNVRFEARRTLQGAHWAEQER